MTFCIFACSNRVCAITTNPSSNHGMPEIKVVDLLSSRILAAKSAELPWFKPPYSILRYTGTQKGCIYAGSCAICKI